MKVLSHEFWGREESGCGRLSVVLLWFPEPQLAVGAVGCNEVLVGMMGYSYCILLMRLKPEGKRSRHSN